MSITDEKALTYEEAKRLCQMAFDAGVDYARTSLQFNCNAIAYDWEHWLEKNKRLFKPEPTVDDVLTEFALACEDAGNAGPEVARIAAEYAKRLTLAKEDA